MAKLNGTGKRVGDRETQEARRALVPELRRIVEDVVPAMLEDAAANRSEKVPVAWKQLADGMRAEVHAEASKDRLDAAGEDDEPAPTEEERRGYRWSMKIARVADMLAYLTRAIREDIGFEENATLATVVLLEKALLFLDIELQDGSGSGRRDDRDENRYRVLEALKALTPRFDDVNMRRLRALQMAETAAKMTRIPTEADVEESVGRVMEFKSRDPDRHRNYVKLDQPVLLSLFARSELAEIDPAFGTLDPLVVLEEFGEAQAKARGGRADGGDGRVGPARALARLAVMCGALEYRTRPDETFDEAVDRARANLLMTRSRVRKTLRGFPGEMRDDAVGETDD